MPVESSPADTEDVGGASDADTDAYGDTDAWGMQHEGALEAAALLDALEQASNVPGSLPWPTQC